MPGRELEPDRHAVEANCAGLSELELVVRWHRGAVPWWRDNASPATEVFVELGGEAVAVDGQRVRVALHLDR